MIKSADRILRTVFSDGLYDHYSKKIFSMDSSFFLVEKLEKEFKMLYPKYYEELEINNLYRMFSSDKYLENVVDNPISYVVNIIEKFIDKSTQERIKFENYFDWLGVSYKVHEESLIEMYKGSNQIKRASSYIINVGHDNVLLNNILNNNNKSEQHMHLKASSINFNFNFFSLMNSWDPEKYLNNFTKEERTKYLQLYVIHRIFNHILDGYSDEDKCLEFLKQNLSSSNLYDEFKMSEFYYIKSNNILESKFESLQHLLNFLDIDRSIIRNMTYKYSNCTVYANIIFYYIYLKNTLRRHFISQTTQDNFSNFQKQQDIKDIFYSDNPLISDRYLESVIILYKELNVSKLEYRITPSNQATSVVEKMNFISNSFDDITLLPTFHFIKFDSIHHKLNRFEHLKKSIDNYYNQCEDITKCIIQNDIKMLTIDAASAELMMPPQYLAPIFRLFRSNMNTELNKYMTTNNTRYTFHVGEVYVNILTGLRRIDEVIYYFNFRNGDRIGHAVALGANVRNFYKKKKNIMQVQGEYLDDLIWLKFSLLKTYVSNINYEFINYKISMLINYLNTYMNSNFTDYDYYLSMLLRSDDLSTVSLDGYPYHESFNMLRKSASDNKELSYLYNIDGVDYDKAYDSKNAHLLNTYYYRNEKFSKFRKDIVSVDIGEEWYTDMIEKYQDMLVKKIGGIGISIELNISSNFYITHIDKFHEHPLFVLFPVAKDKRRVFVSINTDDSAVFDTNINKEYAIITKTLLEQGYPLHIILDYIKELIGMGNCTSWIEK